MRGSGAFEHESPPLPFPRSASHCGSRRIKRFRVRGSTPWEHQEASARPARLHVDPRAAPATT